MNKRSVRDRLAQAAFELFSERGYEQTTVDDITERAGLGRTTFFRHYRSGLRRGPPGIAALPR